MSTSSVVHTLSNPYNVQFSTFLSDLSRPEEEFVDIDIFCSSQF